MTQMTATIQQWLESMPVGGKTRFNLLEILGSIGDRFSSCAVSSAGLAIKAGGSALAKTGSAVTNLVANGIPVAIAGSTDMPALTGTITAGSYNVYCFFIDSAGVATVAQGTEATTLAGVVFPPFPAGKALIGFLTVTYASTFTGGTTPLDTATTTYNSPTGAWDPSVLVGATSY
jgi:hypothetical protein